MMSKKIIIPVIVVGIFAIITVVAMNDKKSVVEPEVVGKNQNNTFENTTPAATENREQAVKEFIWKVKK